MEDSRPAVEPSTIVADLTMDKLRQLYQDQCEQFQVEPNEVILGEIEKIADEKNQKKSLHLSAFHIPEIQCSVLGKVISHDYVWSSIYLNDCNLSSEGLQGLLHGLMTNTTCQTLDLKGNRIHGAGTEALSQVLRKNQTLKKLRLEWNQLGAMDSPAFTGFCEALASNKGLIELDLRNNDISHVGASELAAALKKNCTLRVLDLRWNNLGLIGGRALLATCQSNSTLNDLHIVGNDIPEDIMQTIAHALDKNTEKRQMHFGHSHEMAVVARQLQNAHTDKDRQISSVLQRMSLQEQAMLKANQSLAKKVKKLQSTVDDRKLAFNAISAKNALLEADLTVATQQHHDAQHEIKKMEIDKGHLVQQLRREFKQEKDELFHIHEKLQLDLNESAKAQRHSNERVLDLERRIEMLQTTIHELRETISKADRDHHIQVASLDNENQQLKLKHKEALKDHELSYTRDLQRLKETHAISEQHLKDQLAKLESIRATLEHDNNVLQSAMSTQKLTYDELSQQEKLRLRNEEEKKRHELEDRLRAVTTTKDELESRYNQQLTSNRDFQQKINFQSVEIEALKRQVESVQMTNHSKDTEILENRERLRTDYEKKLRSIHKEIELNDELKARLKQLENASTDQRYTDGNTIRELKAHLADLQRKFDQREHEFTQLKQNEEKRVHFLRSAMLEYINRGTQRNDAS